MPVLEEYQVKWYLQRTVVSYLSDRSFLYDTEDGPKQYGVTGGVPQGSVLSPLLWIIMYNALLQLILRAVLSVALADDLTLRIKAKFLEDIIALFNVFFPK